MLRDFEMAARKLNLLGMYMLPHTKEARDGINVGGNGKVWICYILTLTEDTSWLSILLYNIIQYQQNLITDTPLKKIRFNEPGVTQISESAWLA